MTTATVRSVLAFVIAAMFVGVLGMLMLFVIPTENRDFFNIALGALIASFSGGVVQWYFGSSSGSDEKNAMLAKREVDEPPEPTQPK